MYSLSINHDQRTKVECNDIIVTFMVRAFQCNQIWISQLECHVDHFLYLLHYITYKYSRILTIKIPTSNQICSASTYTWRKYEDVCELIAVSTSHPIRFLHFLFPNWKFSTVGTLTFFHSHVYSLSSFASFVLFQMFYKKETSNTHGSFSDELVFFFIRVESSEHPSIISYRSHPSITTPL